MKRYKCLLIMILFMVSIVGCSASNHSDTIEALSAEAVIEKVTNRETFLLLIVNESCDPCDEFEELLEGSLKKHQVTLYKLNFSDVSNDMADQLQLMLTSYSSWPVLIHVKDGYSDSGNVYEYSIDPKGWETWLIKQGLIPQN